MTCNNKTYKRIYLAFQLIKKKNRKRIEYSAEIEREISLNAVVQHLKNLYLIECARELLDVSSLR